ncbi:MAG: TIGR04348 family glycosyltransferase [Planctomycetes bacterium]|nr:TIGR04348 family glycosyltransferase [Planctomycetota bacterium]
MATLGIVTPAARRTRTGNRVTALRWARRLRELGHRVFIAQDWQGRACDGLIAVHARRSAAAVARFRGAHPDRPVLLLLAGTDIYPTFTPDPPTLAALQSAARLIALQPEAAAVVPAGLRDRVRTIEQSAVVAAAIRPDEAFGIITLAHLRPIKDPLRAAEALLLLPELRDLRVTLVGKALEPELAAAAARLAAVEPRFSWPGELPRAAAMQLLATAHLCVVPSLGEGGANVVSEAIAAGTPLLASRIPGNTGLLGADWPGLFPVGDTAALAGLMRRARQQPQFLAELQQRTLALRPLVAPARERELWRRLLAEVLPA